MFKPRHIKNSIAFRKGVAKFIHYKRHLIRPDALDTIETELSALKGLEATRATPGELEEMQQSIEAQCRKAVPAGASRPHSWLGENVEVLFTAVVIALGIRAFFLQPFKIPTGSMQPTLNGFIAEEIAESEEFPGFAERVRQRLWNGRTFVDVRATQDDEIVRITEQSLLIFFTTTKLHMRSGETLSVPAPMAVTLWQGGLGRLAQQRTGWNNPNTAPPAIPVREGEVLVRASIQGGDHLLVNKMAYHFRAPRRGEVFVFNTKGILGIERSESFRPEFGAQHYIKRLAGVPGDTIDIRSDGELWIDGERATGFGFERVMSMEDGYNGFIMPSNTRIPNPFALEDGNFPSWWSGERVAQPVYWALGDNQLSSLDSRYFGPVPQVNLTGPAFFVYWPLGNHFGRIR